MKSHCPLVLVVLLTFGALGLSAADSVFAPAEVDATTLPVNALQPLVQAFGNTGTLIAQAAYEMPAADYSTKLSRDLGAYAMGAYRVPVSQQQAFGLTAAPAALALTPDIAGLNGELGHMLIRTPADMGLTTRSMFTVPMGWKQFDNMSGRDFQLQNYQDGMREVYRHLQ